MLEMGFLAAINNLIDYNITIATIIIVVRGITEMMHLTCVWGCSLQVLAMTSAILRYVIVFYCSPKQMKKKTSIRS